jgi:hypothetical protein
MDSVDSIRAALSESILFLDELYDDTGIFDHVDAFVCLSRHNETVEQVYLSIPATDPVDDAPGTRRYAIWDKIAEGIGNLRALRKITIWDTTRCLSLTGTSWLASCDVFNGVSSYV